MKYYEQISKMRECVRVLRHVMKSPDAGTDNRIENNLWVIEATLTELMSRELLREDADIKSVFRELMETIVHEHRKDTRDEGHMRKIGPPVATSPKTDRDPGPAVPGCTPGVPGDDAGSPHKGSGTQNGPGPCLYCFSHPQDLRLGEQPGSLINVGPGYVCKWCGKTYTWAELETERRRRLSSRRWPCYHFWEIEGSDIVCRSCHERHRLPPNSWLFVSGDIHTKEH